MSNLATIISLILAFNGSNNDNTNKVFHLKGVVSNVSALPQSNNAVGDLYHISSDGSEYVWLETEDNPNGYWEALGSNNSSSEDAFVIHVTKHGVFDPEVTETAETISAAIAAGKALKFDCAFSTDTYDYGMEDHIVLDAYARQHSEGEKPGPWPASKTVICGETSEPKFSVIGDYDEETYSAETSLVASDKQGYDYKVVLDETQQDYFNPMVDSDNPQYSLTVHFDNGYPVTEWETVDFGWELYESELSGYDYQFTVQFMYGTDWTTEQSLRINMYGDDEPVVFTVTETSAYHWAGDGWAVYYDDSEQVVYLKKPTGDSTDYADDGWLEVMAPATIAQTELVLGIDFATIVDGQDGPEFQLYDTQNGEWDGLYADGTLYLKKPFGDEVNYLNYNSSSLDLLLTTYVETRVFDGFYRLNVSLTIESGKITNASVERVFNGEPYVIHVSQSGDVNDVTVSESNSEILSAIEVGKDILIEFNTVWYDPSDPGPTHYEKIQMPASIREHSPDGDVAKYVISGNALEPNRKYGEPYEETNEYYNYDASLSASSETGYDYEIELTEAQQTVLDGVFENDGDCKFTFGFDDPFDGLKDENINLGWLLSTGAQDYDYEVVYTEYSLTPAEIADAAEISFQFNSESGEADAVFIVEKTSTGHWSGDGWTVYYNDAVGDNGTFYLNKPSGDSTDYGDDSGGGTAKVTFAEQQYQLALTPHNWADESEGKYVELSYEHVHFSMEGLYTNGILYLKQSAEDPVNYLQYNCSSLTISVTEYVSRYEINGLIDWTVGVEVPAGGDVTAYATRQEIPQSGDGSGSTLPEVTTDDDGKFLCVVDGEWAAVSMPSANGVSF